jgi:SprA-related family
MHVRALAPQSATGPGQQAPPAGRGATASAPSDTVTLSGQAVDDPRTQDPLPVVGADPTQELSQAELALVDELRTRDREVRAHEAAHQAAGGTLAGGATFSYQRGPDGKSYAVGGDVPIDLSPGRTPQQTIARARQVRAAALAPSDPSGQDLRVASEAAALEMQAQLQLVTDAQLQSRPQKLPDHLHGGTPCLACEKNAASYAV